MYVCGIATDVCVGELASVWSGVTVFVLNYFPIASTAYHANELGFRTILIDNCSRGINENNINGVFAKLKNEFACVVQSSEEW